MTRSLVTLSLLLSSITVLTVSCGSDELTGDIGSEGGDDGGGVGGTSGSGGKAGGFSTAGKGGSAPSGSNLGRACGASTSCGEGLECLTPLDLPGGLCTTECFSDEDCQVFGALGTCRPEGGGICLQGCQSGGIGLKCHNREDMVCSPYELVRGESCSGPADCGDNEVCSQGVCLSALTACMPSCGSDADCSDGTFCSLELGSCAREKKEGLPIGTACSPADDEDPCEGFCLRYGPGDDEGFCSGYCRSGFDAGLPGCGYDADSTNIGAACLYPSAFLSGEEGDSGFCGQLCDCDAECLTPGFRCVDIAELSNGAAVSLFGRRGWCEIIDEDDDVASIPECDGAAGSGAGGAGGAGGESSVGGAGGASEGGSGGADESAGSSPGPNLDAGSGGTKG